VTHVVPAIRAIQRHWPDCQLTWVIGKAEAALVKDLPGVNIVPFDKKAGWRAFLATWRTLRGQRFDALLHMQVALRASLLSRLISAPLRLGFDRQRALNGQWLFTNARIAAVPRQHVLEGLLEFPRALGVPVDSNGLTWDIPIPEEAAAFANSHLPEGGPVLAINPCTSNRVRNWRNWSIESYVELIDHAAQRYGMRTVLTGGPDHLEREYARKITQSASNTPVNLVGRTSLKELYAVLARVTVMISPDTGPAHMAASAGTPVIGLYASSNPFRTGPYLFRHLTVNKYPEALQQEYGKSPEEVAWGARVRSPKAMELISATEVKDRLDEVMEAQPHPPQD